MHRGLHCAFGMVLLLVVASPPFARAQGVKSGPQPGTIEKPSFVPGPFHPFNVTGDRKGKYHCLVCRYSLRPVVVVFARQVPNTEDPLAVLLQKLDAAVTEHQDVRLASFAVFLSDADDAGRAMLVSNLEDLEKKLGMKNVVLAIDKAVGPDKWDISKDAAVTVVLYSELAVTANFAFSADAALTAENVDTILAAAKKLASSR